MQKTGTASLLAGGLQHLVGGWSSIATLLLIFAIVAVVTQFMSDAATTALFAPVAIALALALGRAPEPYVITVGMAAVVSFLTPIGHHIYGPGRYRFVDFYSGHTLTVRLQSSLPDGSDEVPGESRHQEPPPMATASSGGR
jgi:di/tricarboxylate transporter